MQDINTKFLHFTLLSCIEEIKTLGAGATFQEVSKAKLYNFRIAMPSLAEQQRIVAALEAQMAAADEAKRAAVVALNELRALPGALLRQAFAGEI